MADNEVISASEEVLAFYYHVGEAITKWAHVEFALARIISICFGSASAKLAVDGFMSIVSFRAKLQFVHTIISQQALSEQESANWKRLKKRCANHAEKRNKLAHYWVLNDIHAKPGERIKLLPYRLTANQTTQKYLGAVYLQDVVGYRLMFSALMCALENFGDRLMPREEHFPKSLERPKVPPTLAKIRREIYVYASRQP